MNWLIPAVVIAAATVSMWTHPVLVSIERYTVSRIVSYGGPLVGIAEEKTNKVELTVYDVSPDTSNAAVNDGLTCVTATKWLCNNRTAVDPVNVSNVTTWKRQNTRYCVARCDAAGDIYAFVALIGTWSEG